MNLKKIKKSVLKKQTFLLGKCYAPSPSEQCFGDIYHTIAKAKRSGIQ